MRLAELDMERQTIASIEDEPRHEQWRSVGGFPYEVSSFGNVRRIGGKILKPRVHSNGYLRVSLGFGNDTYIHRLVCAAFHGPAPADNSHADHIDGSRTNNNDVNLRWLSPVQNRALRKIPLGEASHNAKLNEAKVRQILSSAINTADDRTFAAKFGVSRETVRDVRLRKIWRHVNAF